MKTHTSAKNRTKRIASHRRVLAVAWLLLATFAVGCTGQITFSREKKTNFTRVISIPDEAVIYMQNLALMRDRIVFPKGEHLELVLPSRIINESVQLRSGDRIFKAYNIKRGKYTLIRVRDIRSRLVPGKPLVVEYLTWGMYWSAQYRVDIQSDRKIRVQLGAMIQNRWASLSAMKITLVAGWVGNSAGRGYFRRSSLRKRALPALAFATRIGVPGPMVAAIGPLLPRAAFPKRTFRKPRRLRRVRVARGYSKARMNYQSSYRAFNAEVVRKYKIKRVDQTSVQLKSNFQKSFARYYARPKIAQKATGYTLYKQLNADLQLNEQSFVQVADVTLPIRSYYLWPADKGDFAVVVHKFRNNSKVLLPAGMAWLHRRGIYVGQDVCTWTPKGASAHLTTANDGKISVHKKTTKLQGEVELSTLTIRNFSSQPQRVEVFDRNPGYQRSGSVKFSENPGTLGQIGPLHHWKLQVPPRSKRVIKVRYTPVAPKPREAPAKKTAPVRRPKPPPHAMPRLPRKRQIYRQRRLLKQR